MTFAEVTDYQKTLEEESGYDYAIEVDGDKSCRVICTPMPGKEGTPVKIDFSAVLFPAKNEIIVHTAAQSMVGNGKFVAWSEVFRFDSSVKMGDVFPWIAQSREKAASEARQAGLPPLPLHTAATHKMKLIWPLIRKGTRIQHEKKSRAKDNKDGGLFDLDSI